MNNQEHILISLAPRHAENIFAGRKKIELRRRSMNVAPGTIVWIYVTLPVGSIIGRAKIKAIHKASPNALWRQFGSVSGLVRGEFLKYLDGLEEGVVLELDDAKILSRPFSLDSLRDIAEGFNPPQFFIRLKEEHPLFDTFTDSTQRFRKKYDLTTRLFEHVHGAY
ncbi:transcriptional regulator [Undibacterium crateris]|uniref:transcriptional regulator n=1 Tax=Undibacterium crateris TaxID=2528175 RepID=UPI0013893BCC|nr:transcriptional regulator [Undibacterium crateris]NDI85398.1 transcriptional regulator [Undibacterium crateris]